MVLGKRLETGQPIEAGQMQKTRYNRQNAETQVEFELPLSGPKGKGTLKVALQGALMLYLDFINLFLYLLRLFGRRR